MDAKDKVQTVKFAGQGRDPVVPYSAQEKGLMLVRRREERSRFERVMESVQRILRPNAKRPDATILQVPTDKGFQSNAEEFERADAPWTSGRGS